MSQSKVSLGYQRTQKFSGQRGFRSWISEHKPDATPEELSELDTAIQKIVPLPQPLQAAGPASWLDLFDIQKILEWFREYIEWLRSTPYNVNIVNNTSETFSDVVWAYRTKNGVITIDVLYKVTPGNAAFFRHTPCMDMVDYAFAIYINGVEEIRSPEMSVKEVNNLERQVHGQIAMCEDTWDIFPGA